MGPQYVVARSGGRIKVPNTWRGQGEAFLNTLPQL